MSISVLKRMSLWATDIVLFDVGLPSDDNLALAETVLQHEKNAGITNIEHQHGGFPHFPTSTKPSTFLTGMNP